MMDNERDPTTSARPSRAPEAVAPLLSASAAERRRLLLKGVARGGAMLGATVPLKTLAGSRSLTSDKHLCSVSGSMSSVNHSVSTDGTTCTGFVPSFFKTGSAWPQLPVVGGKQCTSSTSCKTFFSRCSLTHNFHAATLMEVATLQAFSSYDDQHWVCAWLNALRSESMDGSMKFPYASSAVMKYYTDSDTNALAFFKGFMEVRTS